MISNRHNWIDLASPFEDGCPHFELVTSLQYAKGYRKDIKEAGETFGLINGCFDILHTGHMWLLNRAAMCCDHLWVAANSDASIAALKPGRPVLRSIDRVYSLLSLKAVKGVVLYGERVCSRILRELEPDVVIKSEEYREVTEANIARFVNYSDHYQNNFLKEPLPIYDDSQYSIANGRQEELYTEHEHYTIAALGCDVAYVDMIPGHSTTSLISKIRLLEND